MIRPKFFSFLYSPKLHLNQSRLLKLQLILEFRLREAKEKHACEKTSTQSEYRPSSHSRENSSIKQNVTDDPAKPLNAHSRVGDSTSKVS